MQADIVEICVYIFCPLQHTLLLFRAENAPSNLVLREMVEKGRLFMNAVLMY